MIPRTVHQIWLGQHPYPACAEPWRAAIQHHLPDWTYRLWTDADVADLARASLCPQLLLDETLGMGMRPDLIRYEILRQHGGLYLDHDMELLGPLDEVMASDCLHFGFDQPGPASPGTAILASPAGHPFWEMHLRRLRATVRPVRPDNPWDVLDLTGPHALSRSIHAWLDGNFLGYPLTSPQGLTAGWLFEHGDLVGWSRDAVYPYHWRDLSPPDFRRENFPQAYAAHHWQGEWFREDREYKSRSLPEQEAQTE